MKAYLTIIACGLSLSACATVSRSTVDHFRIDTVPQGAGVTTTIETKNSRATRNHNPDMAPEYVGCASTPCAIPLPRRSEFIATITHKGYEPARVAIGYSRTKGALAASMVENVGVSTAGGVALGAAVGTISVGLAQLSASVLSSITTSLGGGAVAAPTSGTVAAATASGAAAGVAIGVGSAVIDAASGANLNLYPNPVILELAPEGAPTAIDPNVAILEEKWVQDAIKKAKKEAATAKRKARY